MVLQPQEIELKNSKIFSITHIIIFNSICAYNVALQVTVDIYNSIYV